MLNTPKAEIEFGFRAKMPFDEDIRKKLNGT